MIIHFNPDRLTRQPFFRDLLSYLDQYPGAMLRQIKKDFATVKNLERSLDTYIKAGYIARQDRRYYLSLPLLEEVEPISLDQPIFVNSDQPVYETLMELTFETRLENETNQAVILEETGFARDELTLSNYFHRLKEEIPLSSQQEKLYAIVGDVNPEYALKYMTGFLLKFAKKDLVKQKRPDIFLAGLEVLGYIEKVDEDSYRLMMAFDQENLTFSRIGHREN